MSNIRDDEAMKTTLIEYEPTVSDSVVVTDVVDPGEAIVVPPDAKMPVFDENKRGIKPGKAQQIKPNSSWKYDLWLELQLMLRRDKGSDMKGD